MSADDLLYEPVKQRINAICSSCHKYFDHDVNDPCPPYCPQCNHHLSAKSEADSCCGSGECGCFFYMGWQAFAG